MRSFLRNLGGITALLLLTGCAGHYYQVHDGDLFLYLKQPAAQQVMLACSLDDFELHNTKQVDGRWVVILPSDCSFRYYYVVDGQIFLPPCRMRENDDFGSENCIFEPPL